MDWKNWCKLCGSYEVNEKAESEVEEFVEEIFNIPFNNCNICIDCNLYVQDIQQFLARARKVQQMFHDIKLIEGDEETCLTPQSLLQVREAYELPVPICDVENGENSETFMISDDLQEIVSCNNDPMMINIVSEFMEVQSSEFDITADEIVSLSPEKVRLSSSEERRFKCTQCEKTFKEKRHLDAHDKSHLPNDQKFVHKCSQCEKKYSSVYCLRQHVKNVHEKLALFKCQFCEKEFTRKANLDSHFSHVHTKDRNFECEICGIRLKTKGILKNHKLLHSSDPADLKQCSFCPKQYKTQNQLINHMQTHTKDRKVKKFPCPVCNEKFTSCDDAESHYQTDHLN